MKINPLYFVGIIIAGFFVVGFLRQPSPAVFVQNFEMPKKNVSKLEEVIKKSLEGTKGTYGIAIKNYKTGETYYYNEHRQFSTGSLYKLWVMAAVVKKIEEGAVDENELLTGDISQLNSQFGVSLENADLTNGSITLTVKDALNQMITISHNYAAMLLTKKITTKELKNFVELNEFTESKIGTDKDTPVSTPYDVAKFFDKLYLNQFGNSDSNFLMFDLLKKQTINNAIPRYLPESVVVAHKTAILEGYDHDAGIVYSPKGNYLLVICSQSNYPEQAEERMGQISKAVYDYFQN